MFADCRRTRLAALAGLALFSGGCLSATGGSASLRRDVDSLRVSVDRLRQQQAETRSQIEEAPAAGEPEKQSFDLEMELLLLRDQIDALEAQLRALGQRVEGSDARLGSMAYDLERLGARTDAVARLAARGTAGAEPTADGGDDPALPSPGPGLDGDGLPDPASFPPAVDDPAGLFQKAYADYSRGDYELASLGFRSVLEQRPGGALADDAVYYLAEIAAAQGNTSEALAGFARVENDYPRADKVPAAILKRGLLLLDANRIGEGVVQLDHLAKSYPQTDEARLARNKLRALGVGP